MPSLVVAVMVTGLWTGTTSISRANELGVGSTKERLEVKGLMLQPEENLSQGASHVMKGEPIAQLFYPPVSDDPTFRVVGRGKASQPADKATLLFKFTPDYPDEMPEGTLSDFETTDEPLNKKNLQPIVDALVKIGVTADEIEVKIIKPSTSALPFPFPSTSSEGGGEVVVTLSQPNRDRLEEIVTAATKAADKQKDILLENVKVQYSVNDCQALERAAYQSAVEDGQNRANSIAAALGTEVKRVPSVAEPFYGIFLPGCNSKGSLPFASKEASAYDPNAPVAVEISKDIFFTYRVR
ncbi:SIMPL domain-containing protein [Limnofasciculus baicalensis]|uniref:SIMPL domain-containing protein n=1 Tax=Limnofasciculus baicalensis BBK-W-15 TaxID=2699891 RepID=A0AAE3GQR7_9CYAN|nr:SIMPL domain-containing protein [Limnofasciculus baicalensis]MCP2728809.1 SIMPL domain-containing protein [Limnofasciculus baicalensis BBK-W-15]